MYVEIFVNGQYMHRYAASLFGMGPIDPAYLAALNLRDRYESRKQSIEHFAAFIHNAMDKNHIDHYEMAVIFDSKLNDFTEKELEALDVMYIQFDPA